MTNISQNSGPRWFIFEKGSFNRYPDNDTIKVFYSKEEAEQCLQENHLQEKYQVINSREIAEMVQQAIASS